MRERIATALFAGVIALGGVACDDQQLGGFNGINPLDCSTDVSLYETSFTVSSGMEFEIGSKSFRTREGTLIMTNRGSDESLVVVPENSNQPPVFSDDHVHLNPDGTFTWKRDSINYTVSGIEGDEGATILSLKEECTDSQNPSPSNS